MSESQRIRFGIYEVDPETSELRKNGVPLKLQEQPFKVLRVLLARPGELVSREELKQQIAPESTFGDFDHAVNVAVAKLRTALGDSVEKPVYIETLHKRGYRFIAPVTGQPATTVQIPDGNVAPSPSKIAFGRHWLFAGAAAVLIVGVGTAWWLNRHAMPAPFSGELIVTRVTALPGAETCPAISPDGTRVAFLWNADGEEQRDIFVKVVGSEKAVRLTTGGAESPAWTPDGRHIAYIEGFTNDMKVQLISPLGGDETTLTRIARAGLPSCGDISFSPDGERAFLQELRGAKLAIREYSMKNGERNWVTFPAGNSDFDRSVAMSPDQTRIAFLRSESLPGFQYLFIRDLRKGTEIRLTTEPRNMCRPNWLDNNSLLVSWQGSVWVIKADTGQTRRLNISGSASCPSLAKSGQVVFADVTLHCTELQVFGVEGKNGGPRPIFPSSSCDSAPSFSPDGSQVVFQSTRAGGSNLYRGELRGGDAVRLTNFTEWGAGAPAWSPDGKLIAYDVATNDRHERLYVMNADGSGVRQVTTGSFDDAIPEWSHDGHSLYFASNRTGQWQIWKMATLDGPAVQITQDGGLMSRESPDGSQLYFNVYGKPGIWRISTDGRSAKLVIAKKGKNQFIGQRDWVVSSDGIYYLDGGDKAGATLKFYHFANENSEDLFSLPRVPEHAGPGMALSADGKNLVLSIQRRTESDIVMVERKP